MPTHANYLSTCLSIVTSCHVTCDTRPSASLHVPNEAGRSGNEARVSVCALYLPPSTQGELQDELQAVHEENQDLKDTLAVKEYVKMGRNGSASFASVYNVSPYLTTVN